MAGIQDNPAKTRLQKIGPDGVPKVYSVDEQWQQVVGWFEYLQENDADDRPVLASLNEAWRELDPLYEMNGRRFIERGEDLKRVSDSPLSTFFYFVEMGFYPPPELLLALLDCWSSYFSAGGANSLEEAFFGRPKRKAGNYAAKYSSRLRNMHIRFNFERMVREGLPRAKVAEAISELFGGTPSPESIERMCRGSPFRKPDK